MESMNNEVKKENNVFPFVENQIKDMFEKLQSNPEMRGRFSVGGSARIAKEGNTYEETTSQIQLKIRAAEMVLKEREHEAWLSPSSRELYMQVEIAAKILAIYRQIEKINIYILEAGNRKEINQNFLGIQNHLKKELGSLLTTLENNKS